MLTAEVCIPSFENVIGGALNLYPSLILDVNEDVVDLDLWLKLNVTESALNLYP